MRVASCKRRSLTRDGRATMEARLATSTSTAAKRGESEREIESAMLPCSLQSSLSSVPLPLAACACGRRSSSREGPSSVGRCSWREAGRGAQGEARRRVMGDPGLETVSGKAISAIKVLRRWKGDRDHDHVARTACLSLPVCLCGSGSLSLARPPPFALALPVITSVPPLLPTSSSPPRLARLRRRRRRLASVYWR